jgi:uncharacterized membrane protein
VTAELLEAKHPRTVVAGPYGHPFHPILVTLPIGAWISSLLFDLAATWSGEPEVFVKGAFWLIGIGIVGALAAGLFGLFDLLAIHRGTAAWRTGLTHLALNLSVIALFVISLALRRSHLDEADATVGAVVVSIVALATLAVSGWLGGKLAYRYGVRVVDEGTQATGFSHN